MSVLGEPQQDRQQHHQRTLKGGAAAEPSDEHALAASDAESNAKYTNFFIENILRPDFGHNIDEGDCGSISRADSPVGAGSHGLHHYHHHHHHGRSLGSNNGGESRGCRRVVEVVLSDEDESGKESDDGTSSHGSQEASSPGSGGNKSMKPTPWPAWVYCTRYSDRPSSGEF